MHKETLIRLIELIVEKDYLERNDEERDEIRGSNPTAFAEGYRTDKMKRVEEIENEIRNINI